MQKNKLGRTPLEVSRVAFGTVSLGVPYGIGVRGREDMLREADVINLLRMALDRGVNFFDTARAYGNSEELIGKAFHGCRQQVILATKAKGFLDKDGSVLPRRDLEEIFDASISESLDALQTDYIDLYMSHTGTREVIQNSDVMALMEGYKKRGLVRAVGISTYTCAETRLAIDSGVWEVVQLPFNLMDQRQGALFDHAAAKGVGLVVRSALFKGVLTDRGRHLHPALKSVEAHREKYLPILERTGMSLSQLATVFVLSYPQVGAALLGLDKQEYLEQALALADLGRLGPDVLDALEKTAYPDPDFLDLPRWDRNGWLT